MSSTPSDSSRTSAEANGDTTPPARRGTTARKVVKPVAQQINPEDVLLFLIAFRILNALTIETFFQPDEYFQSLEPAWQLAFGEGSGAWITWEWRTHLRSALHPALFALVYRAVDAVANGLNLSSPLRADLLLAAPQTLQALLAALCDYYTWKLGEQIYGRRSTQAWATLLLTVLSPWQFFCSTRTLSNCAETTMTVIALFNWPWHWSLPINGKGQLQIDERGLRIHETDGPAGEEVDETTRLRRSLLFAAGATILRPTNLLIWLVLATMTLFRPAIAGSRWSIVPTRTECWILVTDGAFCAIPILCLSLIADKLFYQVWTFPPMNFLYFNVVQSIAVFYGNNDWHYYLSQGYPLLLTTALPFTLLGIYRSLSFTTAINDRLALPKNTLYELAVISLLVPAILSIMSHKEVRFIYPLLPPLHVLTAGPLASFFGPSLLDESTHRKLSPPYRFAKRFLLGVLLLLNVSVAIYTTTIHNSGLISITHYLRHQFETYHLSAKATGESFSHQNLTAAFLMPCHSTPWRSHLQYPATSTTPGISAWALTCEPPVNLNSTAREAYLDEADIFYANPSTWLKMNMSRQLPPATRLNRNRPGRFGSQVLARQRRLDIDPASGDGAMSGRREWPNYLIFFAQLESVMRANVASSGFGYVECKRLFNSHWHDDWRRTGDVVVWCLHPERAEASDINTPALVRAGRWLAGQRARLLLGLSSRDAEEQASYSAIPADQIVERPFWKTRPKEPKPPRRWWHAIPGLRPENDKQQAWWRRGAWS